MTTVDNEIGDLAKAAVDIAKIQDPELRHEGGWWLNSRLVSLYEAHLFTHAQRIEFMAIVKILLDVIFADAVESVDDMKEFVVEDSHMNKYIDLASK